MTFTDRLLSLVGLGALVRMAPAVPTNAIELRPRLLGSLSAGWHQSPGRRQIST